MSIQQRLILSGTVAEFDEPIGLGVVLDDVGAEHPFHCTAIADGTRDIEVGTVVSFRLAAARGGRCEAVDIRPG